MRACAACKRRNLAAGRRRVDVLHERVERLRQLEEAAVEDGRHPGGEEAETRVEQERRRKYEE